MIAQHRLNMVIALKTTWSDLRADIEAFGCRPCWRANDLIRLNAQRHPERGCWRLVPCRDAVGPPASPPTPGEIAATYALRAYQWGVAEEAGSSPQRADFEAITRGVEGEELTWQAHLLRDIYPRRDNKRDCLRFSSLDTTPWKLMLRNAAARVCVGVHCSGERVADKPLGQRATTTWGGTSNR